MIPKKVLKEVFFLWLFISIVTWIILPLNLDVLIAKAVYVENAAISKIADKIAYTIYVIILIIFVACFFKKVRTRFPNITPIAVALVLTLLITVNGFIETVLKNEFDRPRPIEITELGGTDEFKPPFPIGVEGTNSKSFPSSTAAIGFLITIPYFFLRDNNKKLAIAFLIAGLVLGSLMGYSRMVGGKHFLTDILWSGFFILVSGIILGQVSMKWKKIKTKTRNN